MTNVIGIKYCGGCNPRYDRKEMKESLQKSIEDYCSSKNLEVSVSYAEEGVAYDFLIVIGGCGNCCASYEQYDAVHVLKIRSEDEEDSVIRYIESKCGD